MQNWQDAARALNTKTRKVQYKDSDGNKLETKWEVEQGQSVDRTELPEGSTAELRLGEYDGFAGICLLVINGSEGGYETLTKLGLADLPGQSPTFRYKGLDAVLYNYTSSERVRTKEDGVVTRNYSVKRNLGPGLRIIDSSEAPLPSSSRGEWLTNGVGIQHLPEALQTVAAVPDSEAAFSNGPFQRTDAHKILSDGIKRPEPITELPTLYSGLIHAFQAESHVGKTYAAYKHIISLVRHGKRVMLMEYENGEQGAIEQLMDLGLTADELDNVYIYEDMPATVENAWYFRSLVDLIQPALVAWDNLASAMQVAGLNEDENDDCTAWHNAYSKPLRAKGVATLVLDHVVKAADKRGRYARGGGAKFNECDVIWNLSQPEAFSPKRPGKLRLHNHKAKRGLTPPKKLDFEAGGPEALFKPTARQADLSPNQRAMSDALEDGMDWDQWKEAARQAGVERQRFTECRDALIKKNDVYEQDGLYYHG